MTKFENQGKEIKWQIVDISHVHSSVRYQS